MRKIILPFFVVLFFLLVNGHSYCQPNSGTGINCNNAVNVPLTPAGVACQNYVLPAHTVVTGTSLSCGLTTGGREYWIKFRPTLANQCINLDITATDNSTGTNVPVEVDFYRRTPAEIAANACPGTLQTGPQGTMCFSDGIGVWAPQAPFNLDANVDYYIRLYSPIANPANLRYRICGRQFSPENDFCVDATPIPATTAGNGVKGDNVCATPSTQELNIITPSWVCASILHNLAWYTFTVSTNGAATVNISGVNCDNYSTSGTPSIQAGLLVLKSGRTCDQVVGQGGSGPPVEPAGNGATTVCSNATSVNLTTRSLAPGTRVYLAIDGSNGSNCTYVLSGTSNIVPIPITLKSFVGWKYEATNLLRWVTSWEQNNAYFEIERSLDGRSFSKIGQVSGFGNSNEDVDYSFIDKVPPLVAYYRMKQVDLDGKYTYTRTVMIKRETAGALDVSFANPVQSSTLLTIASPESGSIHLQIVDVAGRSMMNHSISVSRGTSSVFKDFSKLTSGSYYMVLTQNDTRIVKPFIKQ